MRDSSQTPVKVRFAPLPKRNSHFKNNISIEERLNQSVKNDLLNNRRNLSFSENRSEFGCPRSDYDYRGVELKKILHHNAMMALRAKDKKKINSSDQDSENLSIILNGPKRKRSFDEYENSDDDCSFTQINRNKIARTESYRIPLKNKIISSHFKNNEIKSSYFSIDKNYEENCSKRKLPDQNDSRKLFKIPALSVTHPSSNENSRSNSVENFSNTSISPISKINDKTMSSNNSSMIDDKPATKSSSTASQNNSEDENSSLISNDSENVNQEQSFQYKIPEHFHSIDEHIRDENKAKSRLGSFLKAIYSVTSPFTSKEKVIVEEKKPELVTQTNNLINLTPLKTPAQNNSLVSTVASFILPKSISPTVSTTTNSNFKLPNVSLSTTKPISSTSLNFSSNTSTNTENKNLNLAENNLTSSQPAQNGFLKPLLSSIFSFGSSAKTEEKKLDSNSQLKIDFNLPTTSTTSSVFNFGANSSKPEIKPSASTGDSIFNFGSNNLTQENKPSTNTNNSVFSFGSNNPVQETKSSTSTNNSIFNFGSNNLTQENKLSTNTNNSVFNFGSNSATQEAKPPTSNSLNFNFQSTPAFNTSSNFNSLPNTNSNSKIDSNKPSFNFGSAQATNQATPNFSFNPSNVSKPTTSSFDFNLNKNSSNQNPSFNFGTTAATAKNQNQGFDFSANQSLNNSFKSPSFDFGNNQSIKPSVPNFTFGGDKNVNNSMSKPSLKTESINTGFNFSASNNQLPPNPSFNFNSSTNFKPNSVFEPQLDKPKFSNSNAFNFSGSNLPPQFNSSSTNKNIGFSFKNPNLF